MSSRANNLNLPVRKKIILKSEIIRGFNSYKNSIKSSKIKVNGNIKVFYKFDKPVNSGVNLSSPVSVIPQVGFIVSKKLFSKAVLRNKIRRQLRESYREVKGKLTGKYSSSGILKLIFTLSGKGSDTVKLNGKLNYMEIKNDMSIIIDKIFKE